MENIKPINDKQVVHKLDGLWYKLHSVQIRQKHYTITEADKRNVSEILQEILELRDKLRDRIYLTELEKQNN